MAEGRKGFEWHEVVKNIYVYPEDVATSPPFMKHGKFRRTSYNSPRPKTFQLKASKVILTSFSYKLCEIECKLRSLRSASFQNGDFQTIQYNCTWSHRRWNKGTCWICLFHSQFFQYAFCSLRLGYRSKYKTQTADYKLQTYQMQTTGCRLGAKRKLWIKTV